jgi:hypothetical protein
VRRISAWAALYIAEGDRIRHYAPADMLLMQHSTVIPLEQ